MPHRYSLAEMMGLADRMIARGTSMLPDQSEVKKDTLMAGRILVHLLLSGVIKDAVDLE
jgi:hypothetical protein